MSPIPIRVLLVSSLAFLGVAGFLAWQSWQLLDNAAQVDGTVTEVDVEFGNDGETRYTPTYAYAWEGERRTYTRGMTTSSRPDVGQVDTLLVDRRDPDNVRRKGFIDLWLWPGILGLFAVFSIGAALVLRHVGRTISKRAGTSEHPEHSHEGHEVRGALDREEARDEHDRREEREAREERQRRERREHDEREERERREHTAEDEAASTSGPFVSGSDPSSDLQGPFL